MKKFCALVVVGVAVFGSVAEARGHAPARTVLVQTASSTSPVAGALTLRLTTDRSTYRSGQSVNVTVVFQNTSRTPTGVVTSHAAHLDVRLSIVSRGKLIAQNLPFVGEAADARGVDVAAGGTFVETEPLTKWRYSLPPGSYAIAGEFCCDAGATLRTKTVNITITP